MHRTLKDYIVISLKGLFMGAADAVPGVSGGTIALISGIYDELISTIGSINIRTIKTLKQGFVPFWKAVNGNFLLALCCGILISFITVMQLARYLLIYHPIKIWAFFFGLILASIPFVWKQIKKQNSYTFIALIIGIAIAYYISTLPASANNDSPLFLFFVAALAICAMILPGISGSFVLLILGAYKPLSDAIFTLDIKRIFIFVFGAVIGLLSFSKLLKWLLEHHKNTTLGLLTGFVIGSLNKVWPWKQTLTVIDDASGQISSFDSISNVGTLSVHEINTTTFGVLKTITDKSISPVYYSNLNNVSAELPFAIALMLTGFLLIILLERLGKSFS